MAVIVPTNYTQNEGLASRIAMPSIKPFNRFQFALRAGIIVFRNLLTPIPLEP